MLRTLVHVLFIRPLVRLVAGITAIGGENLAGLDRSIIIANHNSHLDIFVLFSLLPIRDIHRTHAVADREYFSRSRILHAVVRFLFDPVFIVRGRHDRTEDPLEEIRSLLERGGNLIIFPEGTRGNPGELGHFKSGIGRLVEGAPDIPIVPVFLSGPERALPKAAALPLPFWNYVVIGPPQIARGTHRDITRRLEETLTELSRSESSRRHTRRERTTSRPKTVAFLGIDGSGKSTVSRMTAAALSRASAVCLVSDTLEFYERGDARSLQPFIGETVRHAIGSYVKKARSLKGYKLPKLTELLLRNHLQHELSRWYNPEYIVLDGSPLLNMAAWAALYHKESFDEAACGKAIRILSGDDAGIGRDDPIYGQFPELSHLRRLRANTLALPDTVVFMDVTPETACGRIEARGEHRQVHETEEKLAELRRAYLDVCGSLRERGDVRVLVLNGEDTRERTAAAALAFIESDS